MKTLLFLLLFSVSCAGTPATQEKTYGDFIHVELTAPIDDTDRSFIFTPEVNTDLPNASLAWRCYHDGLNVIYMIWRFLGGDAQGQVMVRYRVEKNQPSSFRNWVLLQGNQAAQMPVSQVAEFTEQAEAGTKAVLRVTDPLDGDTYTHEFSLSGLTEGLNQLSCGMRCSGSACPPNARRPARPSP